MRRAHLIASAAERALVRVERALGFCSIPDDELGDGGGGAGGAGGEQSIRGSIQQSIVDQTPGGTGGLDAHKFEYPQHWPEDDRKLFDSVSDAQLRKRLFDRFGAMEKGFQPKLEAASKLTKRYGGLDGKYSKLFEGLEGRGGSVEQYVAAIVALEGELLSGDKGRQHGALKRLAELYKVDLSDLMAAAAGQGGGGAGGGGGSPPPPPPPAVDPETKKRLDAIEGQLTQSQKAQQTQRLEQFTKQIEAFAAAKDDQGNPLRPHFEAVADDIIALVAAEQAAGRTVGVDALEKIYERAVWGREDLRDDLIKQRDAAAARKRAADAAEKAKKAQRAGVSIPANASGGGDDDESLRDTLKSAFRQSASATG